VAADKAPAGSRSAVHGLAGGVHDALDGEDAPMLSLNTHPAFL
jgi:hypothetical protein